MAEADKRPGMLHTIWDTPPDPRTRGTEGAPHPGLAERSAWWEEGNGLSSWQSTMILH